DASVLAVGVFLGVLVGNVGGHLGRQVFGDHLVHPVGIGPRNVAKLLVEGFEDVAQALQLGLDQVTGRAGGYGADLGVLVGQRYGHGRFHLDTVAVHVDGFQDTAG